MLSAGKRCLDCKTHFGVKRILDSLQDLSPCVHRRHRRIRRIHAVGDRIGVETTVTSLETYPTRNSGLATSVRARNQSEDWHARLSRSSLQFADNFVIPIAWPAGNPADLKPSAIRVFLHIQAVV